ncbi:serine protease gd-like [Chironomus tepperi]|uniref:serine protease gd-like n=1 Tax=Chironomus tepperi TaxID=113505 RepID=UPI00391EF2DD
MSYSSYILVFIFTIFMSINHQSTAATTTCGKSLSGHVNVFGGAIAERGDHPWKVALVKSDGNYLCGATLFSTRKVITSANCMQDKEESKPRLPSSFIAVLGIYDLNDKFEIGRTSNAIRSVHVHPEWNIKSDDYDADIAVLVLADSAVFTKYIQPACIVHPDTNEAAIAKGVIIGYGKSEDTTKIHENIPRLLEMPIHTNQDCFIKFPLLEELSSKRTFCAGSANGAGPCNGDSGGGLFVYANGKFYLRGIVSSVLIGGQYGCDIDAYAVFTDVTKYVDWINGVSLSRYN